MDAVKRFFSPFFSLTSRFQRNKESSVWDNSIERYIENNHKVYWETLNEVAHYQFECISGDRNRDILSYCIDLVREKIPRSNLTGGLIGCHEMNGPEFTLIRSGLFSEIHIFDIAKGLIEKQRNYAKENGFENIYYHTTDLNRHEFKSKEFDLVFGWGTVHHIENLEHFFSEVVHSLKNEGLFLMREYVGPNFLQLTKEQLSLANSLLQNIPKEYRFDGQGKEKKERKQNNLRHVIKTDPSEAVRSEDIIPLLHKHFNSVEVKKTGGTILGPVLDNIAGNFERDERGKEVLLGLIQVERALVEANLIPSDYVFTIAQS